MSKMHENEFDIDESLVRSLLQTQCPKWKGLPLKKIISSGTDNALFRLGNEYVVRLPRIPGASDNIDKEYKWVPKLAKLLETPISEPLIKGDPSQTYPSLWMISKWNEGTNPDFEKKDEYQLLAKDLAFFLNKLHAIKLPNGPISRSGLSLYVVDEEMRIAIAQLKGEIDTKLITDMWTESLNIPDWNRESVWVHGDFLPGNILVQNNHLSAALDFSDVGIGDPACDCVIAWALMNSKSRKIFRTHLENIDEATWLRGRAWALSIAVIMLPYYMHTNPVLVALARRVIEQVIVESVSDLN